MSKRDSISKAHVGIDWGYTENAVCVLAADGSPILKFTTQNVHGLVAQLKEALPGMAPVDVTVAIERRDLPVVDALLVEGYRVVTINPKQVDRFRDRYSMAGAKDDKRDAFVLADTSRTDGRLFDEVKKLDDDAVSAKNLSRMREQIAKQERWAANQLFDLVYRIHPSLIALCPGADQVWFLELIGRVLKTPPNRIQKATVEQILKRCRVRRVTAADVIKALREPPSMVSASLVEDVRFEIALVLEQVLGFRAQRALVDARMESLLEKMSSSMPDGSPSDAAVLRSMSGFGLVVTMTMIGEMARPLAERDHRQLRLLTGIAPVTKQSGKSHVVVRRRACNRRAQQAMFHAARVASANDPHFKSIYQAMRTRGQSRGRALRGVGDAMLRVLSAMLRERTPYDPSKVGARTRPTGLQTEPEVRKAG